MQERLERESQDQKLCVQTQDVMSSGNDEPVELIAAGMTTSWQDQVSVDRTSHMHRQRMEQRTEMTIQTEKHSEASHHILLSENQALQSKESTIVQLVLHESHRDVKHGGEFTARN